MLDARLKENERFVEQDGDVAALFGTANGKTIVVVAGGPTAESQFDWLWARRSAYTIVLVSTALKSLVGAGIVPDVVIVIDPKREIADHFDGCGSKAFEAVPLVYLPTVHEAVLERWPGPRLATYIDRPRFRKLHQRLARGTLFCAGSVTHTAVDLAVRMGGGEIVLVGADFSFPGGRLHVAGAAETAVLDDTAGAAHPFVVNGLGERNMSRTDMVGFLRDLESYIAARPEVRFRNTGREGAEIAGAPWVEGNV